MNVFYLTLAFAAGSSMAVQAAVNSRLSVGIGTQPLLTALVSFTVGGVLLAFIALAKSDWHTLAAQASGLPWWYWTGGLLGCVFVSASILLAPKIGITQLAFLMILGQLSTALLIDGLGLLQMPVRPVMWWKYFGLAVMMGGLVLFSFGDKLFGR